MMYDTEKEKLCIEIKMNTLVSGATIIWMVREHTPGTMINVSTQGIGKFAFIVENKF